MMRSASPTGVDTAAVPCRFGIVTALPTELAAVHLMLLEYIDISIPDDPNPYFLGSMPSSIKDRVHWVVVTMLAKPGNNSAAASAAHLLRSFPQVEHVVMVGIAGGVPNPKNPSNHVQLGDVVVSNDMGIIAYDHLKVERDRITFREKTSAPSAFLLSRARVLEAKALAARGKSPLWVRHEGCTGIGATTEMT